MFGGNCGQQILQSYDVKHFVHAQPFSIQKNICWLLPVQGPWYGMPNNGKAL